MEAIINPAIETIPRLLPAVEHATRLLEEELGPSAGPVRAEWSLDRDERGRPMVRLRLADWTGAVAADFVPEELDNPMHVQARLHRLWGELLRVRSREEIRKLREMVEQLQGEET